MNLLNHKIVKISLGALFSFTLHSPLAHSAQSEGQALYETTCAACHGKDLSGGAGFNLKDETWVHGDKPSEILANIKKGFGQAGMPGFEAVYSEQQLKSIVDYILSKRQGFENLTYKIYHLEEDAPADFSILKDLKAQKSGKVPNNIIDFTLPEVKNYIIEFEGDLNTPKEHAGQIFAMVYKELFEVEIDGKLVQPSQQEWLRVAWPLKAGKQHFKIRYSTVGTRQDHNKNFNFFVADQALTQKLFGISTGGKQFLNKATVNIKAESQPQVVRKKIVNLPTSSVAVGFPEKINYAFNTKNCSINGIWTGDLLNIGPNIEGRGRDGGVILGEWLFHSPQAITHHANNCVFNKYNRQGNPIFEYALYDNQYSVQVKPESSQSLTFIYTLLTGKSSTLALTLPTLANATFSSQDGSIQSNQFSTQAKVGQSYAITLTLKESK
ncbi:cytochrome c [Paraglaciecola aquimarina]|uniref:Cytochrome c n=1 Tax=Paraglaciecola algarum TaxID=3050085 RepID=A0ABS9D9H8_9ALTE|nr:cytochrome c [Paraglaciecola sp. G1-23]MCF2949384.1 cytochrome c [Paraglaciecola sp. G1-23]